MKERHAYYAARAKAISHPDKYISIILDAMDQRKTRVPFFTNPAKAVANDFALKTKLFGATVHGLGTYFYWCTGQVRHDTNLSIEVLRQTLLKYESEKGQLPPILYLQLDNAADNKSRQFLAFLAYLVEMGVFETIKVSYLIVGHTHEDIDQKFSQIGRYIKKILRSILTMEEFEAAIKQTFAKQGAGGARCVEQIKCTFDTRCLVDLSDQELARFSLPEKTGDNVHHFVLRLRNGRATMQYKLKRYSVALWPRKYNPGQTYLSKRYGSGVVMNCEPRRDEVTKEKYWDNTVKFVAHDDEVVFYKQSKQDLHYSFHRAQGRNKEYSR
jgi:hypothetical protein